jgi:hypothetical protein
MKKKLVLSMAAVLLALVLRWYASIGLPTDYDKCVYFPAVQYYTDSVRRDPSERIPNVTFSYEHSALAKMGFRTVLAKFPSRGPDG